MGRLKKFKGTALVTGGARRIGEHICLHLAGMGYKIALHYHSSAQKAARLAEKINRTGICRTFSCDLKSDMDVDHLIPKVFREFSDCCLLINNASVFERSHLLTVDHEHFDQQLAINFKAPYFLTSAFARACPKRGKGHVINILDTHIQHNSTQHFNYLLMKKTLRDFTQMAAVELAPDIRVNGIAPGLILPPPGEGADYLDRLAKRIPLKRRGRSEHISHALQFLIENNFVTGQILYEDGGEHLT